VRIGQEVQEVLSRGLTPSPAARQENPLHACADITPPQHLPNIGQGGAGVPSYDSSRFGICRPVTAMISLRIAMLLILLAFLVPLGLRFAWWVMQEQPSSWNTADWSSAGLLPAPATSPQASVHIFSAPAGRWKGILSQHSWVVIKERGAAHYTRFDVVGWGSPVRKNGWAPDGKWYGSVPRIVASIEGTAAEALIPRIRHAVASYPHSRSGDYRVWPGPNSNTFVAAVLAEIPEAGIVLPSNAIGKDYRDPWLFVGLSPTRSGVQVSVMGLIGVTIAWMEGLEVNLFGLVAGLDLRRLAIKLPGWGPMAIVP
jgi:hypothetical protein